MIRKTIGRLRTIDWRVRRFALAWHGASVGIGLIVSLLLIAANPLNLDQGLAERGRDLFYKVAAFAYPSERSPKVLVVTINDEFLRERDLSWPMPYRAHAFIIDEIASRHPKAIFIDLPFVHRRPDETLTELVATIRRASANIPIYIAAAPPVGSIKPAIPEILELAETAPNVHIVSIAMGRSLGTGDAYPTGRGAEPSPAAVKLYTDLFADGRAFVARSPEDEIDPWWAVPQDRFNCRGEGADRACAYLGQGVARRLLYLVVAAFLPEPAGVGDVGIIPVPYSPSIRAQELFKGDVTKELNRRLTNATVFYGADIVLTGDRQESPAQGPLPGVYVHAMVFDNLVAFRGRYIGTAAPFGLGRKSHAMLLVTLMALLVLVARIGVTAVLPKLGRQPHLQGQSFAAVDLCVLICAGLMVAIYEFAGLHVGPGAWATVLAAAATGKLIAGRSFTAPGLVWMLRRRRTAGQAVRRKPRWRR